MYVWGVGALCGGAVLVEVGWYCLVGVGIGIMPWNPEIVKPLLSFFVFRISEKKRIHSKSYFIINKVKMG